MFLKRVEELILVVLKRVAVTTYINKDTIHKTLAIDNCKNDKKKWTIES